MKKALFTFALLLGLSVSVRAYDFSYTYQGQTLYYNIEYGYAKVTYQNSYYSGPNYTNLSGALTIPESVTYNGNTYAVTSIDIRAFLGCSGLTSVTIPNSVTSIGHYAFNGCSGLTSVTIPNSVTYIGEGAFQSCSGLTTVNFNATNCTTMGYDYNPVFSGCTNLATLNIGENVTQIPACAFYGCSGLTSVTIPNSVTSIGASAFQNCSGLTSVTIPNSVTSIGDRTFQNCSGLTSVTIPNSVTSIGYCAFYGCSGLTSVTIPNSVTSIGSSAFSGCSGLTSVTIPNSVTSIGSSAFYGCSGLTSVTIPNSVTSIGNYAFNSCDGLTSVNFNADSCTYAGESYNNSLLLPFGPSCTSLTTVNVGSNVKALPDYIFAYCTNLTNINLPDSLKYIGRYALSNTAISGSITIPNSVTRINDAAFWRCYNITNITLPNTLSDIGISAFREDTNLVSINLPSSLEHIRESAFRQCYQLASVDLSHVSIIDSKAFNKCLALTSLTIPSNVTEIAYAAFATCTGLLEITFEGRTPPIIGDSAFIYISSNIPVYIPCGTLALYAARLPYVNNFIEETFTFSAVSENDNKGTVQVLNEPTCTNPNAVLNAVPASGYRFDHWSTGSTSNPYSLTVTSDTVITAYFVSDGPQMFTITVEVNDAAMGSVTGGGEYAEGSSATLTAIPNNGYTFALWLDGNTDNPRIVTVTGNATYTAVFQLNNGFTEIDANGINIYTFGDHIVVEGVQGETVRVYDMMGRLIQTFKQSSNQALPAGVYLVKVGNVPARRVVVIR